VLISAMREGDIRGKLDSCKRRWARRLADRADRPAASGEGAKLEREVGVSE